MTMVRVTTDIGNAKVMQATKVVLPVQVKDGMALLQTKKILQL